MSSATHFIKVEARLWVGKFRFAKKVGDLYSPLKKVCLTAFAESEFGNPFYHGRSPIMGWQILTLPIMSETFKKVCLTAFAESEFGNP